MNFIKKIEESHKCLEDFKASCNSEECKQLIDIFLPMLYQQNTHRLDVSVGKKISDTEFSAYLSTHTRNFVVMLNKYDDKPQLVINDKTHRAGYTIIVIDLAKIKNLHIETISDKDIDYCAYKICFNYGNGLDYSIRVVIKKRCDLS